MQNGFCESCNGRMLNETLFFGRDHAREKVRFSLMEPRAVSPMTSPAERP